MMTTQDWVEQVQAFWFNEIRRQQWFEPDPALDDEIRRRFGDVYAQLSVSIPDLAYSDATTALTAVIVLDQFPRNMFRGKREAFKTDTLACSVTRNAVSKELDTQLTPTERQFLYMPLMHSEILADQEWGVSLFRSLQDEESLRYAIEHRDIIARFGRFPHRNLVLGRQSTLEEEEFLRDANRYGQ